MTGDLSTKIASAVRAAATQGDGLAVVAALHSVHPTELEIFFHATLEADAEDQPLGTGLPASPGAASGVIVLSASAAMDGADNGESVILVRQETTPDDVVGMEVSAGVLTARGGLVSHAAVVARGWGIPAVVGAADVHIDGSIVTIGDVVLHEGDAVTIDGGTGHIYAGQLATTAEQPPPELEILLDWADSVSAAHVEVRANADTAGDATVGRRMGAQGIGLCRTEHMFLAADRLEIMRRFILSDDAEAEASALAALGAAQTADFEWVLAAMDGLPVTVRLLDPPLHEFLPELLDLTAAEAKGELDESGRLELAAVRRLREVNPMLGTRGVRVGVIRNGLYQMQVRALCQAAVNLFERGLKPRVEVMIPLVVDPEELRLARSWVTDVLDEIGHPELGSDHITVGAMIETPRAAVMAGALAEHADFFSFGTNDLTQLTFAFSRDDVESLLLPAYQEAGILAANPFAVLDQDGVGELVRIACARARATKPGIKLGACGEHAGDPDSADFLVRLGLDSVSCSPFRIPLARLGVAQALLRCGRVEIDDVEFDLADPLLNGLTQTGSSSPASESSEAEEVTAALPIDHALVLHVLRVRGFVTSDGFLESLGAHPTDLLISLIDEGHVRHIESRDMYALLPSGTEQHRSLLDSYAGEPTRRLLTQPYEAFLELNGEFKALCTRWQMRGEEANDHSDADYDSRCFDDLGLLHEAAQPVIAALASAVPRLDRYRSRLRTAARQVAEGNTKMFTGVACGSFHDIWMELHEDLLVLQRIERSSEGSF